MVIIIMLLSPKLHWIFNTEFHECEIEILQTPPSGVNPDGAPARYGTFRTQPNLLELDVFCSLLVAGSVKNRIYVENNP